MTETQLCQWLRGLLEMRKGATFTRRDRAEIRERIEQARARAGKLYPFTMRLVEWLERPIDAAAMINLRRDVERQLDMDQSWTAPSDAQTSRTTQLDASALRKMLDDRAEQQATTSAMKLDELRRLIDETKE